MNERIYFPPQALFLIVFCLAFSLSIFRFSIQCRRKKTKAPLTFKNTLTHSVGQKHQCHLPVTLSLPLNVTCNHRLAL